MGDLDVVQGPTIPTPAAAIQPILSLRPDLTTPPSIFQPDRNHTQPVVGSSSPVLHKYAHQAATIVQPATFSPIQSDHPVHHNSFSSHPHFQNDWSSHQPAQMNSLLNLQQSALTVLNCLAGIQTQAALSDPNTHSISFHPSSTPPLTALNPNQPPPATLPRPWPPPVCVNAQATPPGLSVTPPSPFYNTLANSPYPLSYPPRAVHCLPQPPMQSGASIPIQSRSLLRRTSSEPSVLISNSSSPSPIQPISLASSSLPSIQTSPDPPKPPDPHINALSPIA